MTDIQLIPRRLTSQSMSVMASEEKLTAMSLSAGLKEPRTTNGCLSSVVVKWGYQYLKSVSAT